MPADITKQSPSTSPPSKYDFVLLQDELIRASRSPNDEYVDTSIFFRSVLKHANLDFVYVFPKPLDCIDKLKQSLQDVLTYYPTLAGRFVDAGDRVRLSNHGVAFRVQAASNPTLSIKHIPNEPSTGPPYCYIPIPGDQVNGKAPLLTVTVTNFVDGSTLGVVINHIVADAWTFAMFMKDWSDVHGGKTLLQPVIYQFPKALTIHCETQKEADQAAEALGMQRSTSWIKSLVFRVLIFNIIPMMVKKKDPRLGKTPKRQVIHYSDKQVQTIKARAERRAGSWVSTNEAMLTHVWQILLDAACLLPSHRARIGVRYSVNLRRKVSGLTERTAGSLILVADTAMDMNDFKGNSVEKRIHDATRKRLREDKILNDVRLGNFLFSKDGENFALYDVKTVGNVGTGGIPGCLRWNWQATNPYYLIDFGAGSPIRGIPWDWQEPVTILPGADGGVDVFIDTGPRGPVSWKSSPASKWATIRNVFGVVFLSGSWAMSIQYAKSQSVRLTAILWFLSASFVLVAASICARRESQASEQAFHDYVSTHAHDMK